jgi:glycine cleavage system H protein
VYIDLPDIGDTFDKGDSFGSVESVKAASDVYCPVGGKIVDVNSKLSDEPSLVNTDAETDAWFVKIEIKDPTELEGLLDPAKYKEHCDKQP